MFAIAPTDLGWFAHMQQRVPGRVVNFWTPTPWGIKSLREGDRLYFMLKSPVRRIGGYGLFVKYAKMTAIEAWVTYGLGNGVDSQQELVDKIKFFAYRRSAASQKTFNPLIGCIELADIVTLDNDRFIDLNNCIHSFATQVVKIKYFHEEDEISTHLIEFSPLKNFAIVTGAAAKKTSHQKDRKCQSVFRKLILQNYGHRCCILGESTIELLEAAHIQPYVDERSNHPQNGLCLRVDLHRLFDEGLITISEQYTLQVSSRLNGTSYANLAGKRIFLPAEASDFPSSEALAYQRQNFR